MGGGRREGDRFVGKRFFINLNNTTDSIYIKHFGVFGGVG